MAAPARRVRGRRGELAVDNSAHDDTRKQIAYREAAGDISAAPDAAETLVAVLHDLAELRDYLAGRGRHTYDLAQRFLESSRRNEGSRAYDERQATMLEYQHYIWHEIAGLVDKLLATYTAAPSDSDREDAAGPDGEES